MMIFYCFQLKISFSLFYNIFFSLFFLWFMLRMMMILSFIQLRTSSHPRPTFSNIIEFSYGARNKNIHNEEISFFMAISSSQESEKKNGKEDEEGKKAKAFRDLCAFITTKSHTKKSYNFLIASFISHFPHNSRGLYCAPWRQLMMG